MLADCAQQLSLQISQLASVLQLYSTDCTNLLWTHLPDVTVHQHNMPKCAILTLGPSFVAERDGVSKLDMEGPKAAVAALDEMLSEEQCTLLVEAIINKYIVLSAEELQEWQACSSDYHSMSTFIICA